MARIRTKTSDFGVSKREGHDASQFYSSRLYDGFIINEKKKVIDRSAELPKEIFNKLLYGENLKTDTFVSDQEVNEQINKCK